MIATLVLAASLAGAPASHTVHASGKHLTHIRQHKAAQHELALHQLAVTLHPMTEEDKRMYPGRENWDKTEWYEDQFKSAKITLLPQHVDEWKNGGIDLT